jgi:hypothetical protein
VLQEMRRRDKPTKDALKPEVAVWGSGYSLARAGGASQAGLHAVASGILRLVESSVGGVQQFLDIGSSLASRHSQTQADLNT